MTRLRFLLSRVPVPVATDRDKTAARIIGELLAAKSFDIVVFDFPHSTVLARPPPDIPSILFTHNVESEIFRRHVDVAKNPLTRFIWNNQYKKMLRFEREAPRLFTRSVAVSGKDQKTLSKLYDVNNVGVIRTGVDLVYFPYHERKHNRNVIFTGAMDWLANIDAIDYLMDEIWPLVASRCPDATMTVVGRNPPNRLVGKARSLSLKWEFTGFVDDVRPYVRGASVYAIPLRVGGGTRLKVYEAMAMGSPIVSTTIGVEGLSVEHNTHFVAADDAQGFANALCELMENDELGDRLAKQARAFVEENYSHEMAARDFELICLGKV